jgi:hypothetical protein
VEGREVSEVFEVSGKLQLWVSAMPRSHWKDNISDGYIRDYHGDLIIETDDGRCRVAFWAIYDCWDLGSTFDSPEAAQDWLDILEGHTDPPVADYLAEHVAWPQQRGFGPPER